MKMRDHRRRLYRVQRARVVPSRLRAILNAGQQIAAAWCRLVAAAAPIVRAMRTVSVHLGGAEWVPFPGGEGHGQLRTACFA
ncbi:hypothetical protein [Burkholderia glumae]|uniref:hypothetical protein n=1 Tax=Burkholderia glumae TaxID=337 RepID=UPI0020CF77A1|nr:hypothetical protein [Burkholderia glumae]MCQ0029668.1 hypothetical protein [Burkholderia glumae]MCQ0035482.1 hypothetical protein [Burkholderia glumae]